MKTPQEIATTILGKEPTLDEERIIWRGIVEGIEADRAQRVTPTLGGEDWEVEFEDENTVALNWYQPGEAGWTEPRVAHVRLTHEGASTLAYALNPGA